MRTNFILSKKQIERENCDRKMSCIINTTLIIALLVSLLFLAIAENETTNNHL